MKHARLYDIMAGDDRSALGHAVRLGLSVMAPGYRLAIWARNRLFDLGLRKPAKLPRRTISVGNLTTGGTGKTPMVIELARKLAERGSRPAVLMRGYMADKAAEHSDEAQELACELGSSVPVEPNPNRVAAANRVMSTHPQTDVFLLDDGFQHRQVHRDLDLVLIDATRPFGLGHLLPRGLMREPAGNLRRADAVILTRCDLVSRETLTDLDKQIQTLIGRPVTAHAVYRWTGFRSDDNRLAQDHFKTLKTVGLCAIGNPKAFEAMLDAACGEILICHAFDDHHAYTADEVHSLLADAQRRGAQAVVMTEKDWVKCKPLLTNPNTPEDPSVLSVPPVIRPILGVKFLDGAEAIDRMLRGLTTLSG